MEAKKKKKKKEQQQQKKQTEKQQNGVKAVIINMQYCANMLSIGILKIWAKT